MMFGLGCTPGAFLGKEFIVDSNNIKLCNGDGETAKEHGFLRLALLKLGA